MQVKQTNYMVKELQLHNDHHAKLNVSRHEFLLMHTHGKSIPLQNVSFLILVVQQDSWQSEPICEQEEKKYRYF